MPAGEHGLNRQQAECFRESLRTHSRGAHRQQIQRTLHERDETIHQPRHATTSRKNATVIKTPWNPNKEASPSVSWLFPNAIAHERPKTRSALFPC
jgi:hypothetical protein